MLDGTDHHSICKFALYVDQNFQRLAKEMAFVLKTIRANISKLDEAFSRPNRHTVSISSISQADEPRAKFHWQSVVTR